MTARLAAAPDGVGAGGVLVGAGSVGSWVPGLRGDGDSEGAGEAVAEGEAEGTGAGRVGWLSGSNGSVPASTSSPLVKPSPSSSAFTSKDGLAGSVAPSPLSVTTMHSSAMV